MLNLQAGNSIQGLLDNTGKGVDFPANATAITYELCKSSCGANPEPFQWSIFSSQFSAWLLPWLALISQLPFGSRYKSDNLMSMMLTVGSPALGAYSLIFTVLNGQHVARRLSGIKYPNIRWAWRVLSSLQQSALRIDDSEGHLSSLLAHGLDYTQTWSLSAVSQILWVLIAYLFTVIDSLADPTNSVNSSGQGVGAVFLWLLPIVIGYLQLSPKCDFERVRDAVDRANSSKAYRASAYSGIPPERVMSGRRGLYIEVRDVGDAHRDEQACAPVFNYARFLHWTANVEVVASAFEAAAANAANHIPVGTYAMWMEDPSLKGEISGVNRQGDDEEVRRYTQQPGHLSGTRSLHATGVIRRFLVAAFFALFLQWGTIGGGIVVVLYTPTRGLGCRSGAYILYAVTGTIIWLLMVLSSFLSYYAATSNSSPVHTLSSARVAAILSTGFRRIGKVLAILNATWIVVVCVFQFASFFDRCYCNSSVLGLGRGAYDVINFTANDVHAMKAAWIGSVALSLGTATLFVLFVALYVDPPGPVSGK
ncbi:hypothetical protein PENSPDRAFT_744607 [Peniophora sp. CONT]|nr:hypothetical protein PENSPDRAFT_744607 [Peniophora sp. CONT]